MGKKEREREENKHMVREAETEYQTTALSPPSR